MSKDVKQLEAVDEGHSSASVNQSTSQDYDENILNQGEEQLHVEQNDDTNSVYRSMEEPNDKSELNAANARKPLALKTESDTCNVHETDCVSEIHQRDTDYNQDSKSRNVTIDEVVEGDQDNPCVMKGDDPDEDEKNRQNCRRCNGCEEQTESTTTCSSCKAVLYCGSKCQRRHWKQNKVLCAAIQQLTKDAEDRIEEACAFESHLAPKQKQKIASVIGKRCMIDCMIDGQQVRALWDTGSQVALLSRSWITKNLGSEVKIEPLARLLGRDIEIEGVGGSAIPYEGYIELPFELKHKKVIVPFLVTKQCIQDPIIGFNVIAMMSADEDKDVKIATVKAMLGDDVDEKTIIALIDVLEDVDSEGISSVRVPKEGVRLKSGETTNIRCKVEPLNFERKTPVLFEPEVEDVMPAGVTLQTSVLQLKKGINTSVSVSVTNTNMKEVWLSGRLSIGNLQLVKSVTPAEVTRADDKEEINTDEVVEGPQDKMKEGDQVKPVCANVSLSCQSATGQDEDFAAKINATDEGKETLDCEDQNYRRLIDEMDLSMLSADEQQQAREVFWKERAVFSSGGEIGCAEELVMSLKTNDEVPVQRNYNSIPRPLISEVKNHVEDLLNRKWISRSQSSWSSPVVIVRKKNGEIRLCCDFRALNKKTVQDKHPLPRVQETLDSLGGSQWFTVLDQSRAYYQGFIAEEDRHKTAFVSPWGLYEWVRIPFGLTNAPAKFQRYMEETVADFRDKFALPYLDDVIVYSKSLTEHLGHISQVLQRMKERGLKLNLSKCKFFQPSVKFLGRVVTKDGYRMDDDSIAAAKGLKEVQPKNVSDVRHIMGLLGYHRRNVQDFSRRAKPITNLLLTKGRTTASGAKISEKKMAVDWTNECQIALDSLIEAVTTAPIMAYPDFSEEFILHTDASLLGLGCILYQKQEGKMRVIAYGSRTLNKAEANYHPSKLEFLALKWAVTEKFREYLGYADHFRAFTDNNPLVYCMETKKMTAYSSRWISELSEFNFTIKYRPGKVNTDADCFSRLPIDIDSFITECTEEVGQDAFRAIMAGVKLKESQQEAWRFAINAINVNDLPKNEISLEMIGDNIKKIKSEQADDKNIASMLEMLRAGIQIKTTQSDSRELKILKRGTKKLIISDEGVLVRRSKGNEQIVLPKNMRKMIYQNLHVDMGHLGKDKVLQLAKQRVYWPGMEDDIAKFINESCVCLMQRKPCASKKAELQSIITSLPMELIAVDFVKLEKGCGGYQYILVIVDHFTRFAQAYPTKNKSAKTAAQRIYQDFLLRFGIPDRLMSDQGGEFQNKTISELNKIIGIEQSRTTPYHPQSNGACERMNETLLRMLRALPESTKSRWPQHLNQLIHAYNCMQHCSTGYSPFKLMYGREPRLPIDLLLSIRENKNDAVSYKKYVEEWKRGMEEAFAIAKAKSSKRKEADRKRWNARPLLSTLRVGDRVLVQNKERREGPSKLVCHWEPNVHKVTKVMDENNVVYSVKREDGKGRHRVLHRNMLLPVGDEFEITDNGQPQCLKRKSKDTTRKVVEQSTEEESECDSDSDEGPTFFPSSLDTRDHSTLRKTNHMDAASRLENVIEEYMLDEMLTSDEEVSDVNQDIAVGELPSEDEERETLLSLPDSQPETIEEYVLDRVPSSEDQVSDDESDEMDEDSDIEQDLIDYERDADDDLVAVVQPDTIEEYVLDRVPSSEDQVSDDESDEFNEDSDVEQDLNNYERDADDDEAGMTDRSNKEGEVFVSGREVNERVENTELHRTALAETPLTKARSKRLEDRRDERRKRRDDVTRERRPNFDLLSQESPVKATTIEKGDNEVSEGAVGVDNELPRALRAIADFNNQGLKESARPTNTNEASDRAEVLEESNDLGRPEHESTTIDDGLDETWNISDAYFDVEPEEPPRRGTRNRQAPVKYQYDVIGDPNVNTVSARRSQREGDERFKLMNRRLSELITVYERITVCRKELRRNNLTEGSTNL